MASPIIEEMDGIKKASAPMILVLGETGAGKSHFINRLAGESVVRESARLQSCTQRPELVEIRVGEHEFLMVDTPGFNDTWRSDADVLVEIGRTLTLQMQLGVKLRGILYLHNLSSPRLTSSHRRQLNLLQRICGAHSYPNILLLTTHWPATYSQETSLGFGVREAELPSTEPFWKEILQNGGRMLRWYDDEEGDGARAIVAGLVGKRDVVLQLQEELMEGKLLRDTSAGAFVVDSRRGDEAALAKLQIEAHGDDAGDGIAGPEVTRMQESLEARKAAEARLQDDSTSRVRREIRHLVNEARRRKKQLEATEVFRWLIGISELTVQLVQTALTA